MKFIDGRYISNGNKNLYVKITGSGTPPIVIETGLGSLSVEWSPIQEELSKTNTVITYDRAGYGESPSGQKPRSGRQIVGELFNMLRNSGVAAPYILVGHSAGGLYAQHFAKMFPREVCGIVLVDSMSVKNDELDRLETPIYQKSASIVARTKNIKRLLEMEDEDFKTYIEKLLNNLYSDLPAEIANQLLVYHSDKKFYSAVVDEFEAYDESFRQVKEISDFPNIPLKVLCRDYEVMVEISRRIGIPEDEARIIEEKWLLNSRELAELSNDSEFFIIKGSSHSIHLTRPDAVIEAINSVINSLK